jgi:hypothetical protein
MNNGKIIISVAYFLPTKVKKIKQNKILEYLWDILGHSSNPNSFCPMKSHGGIFIHKIKMEFTMFYELIIEKRQNIFI